MFQVFDNILWGLEVKFFTKEQFDKAGVKMQAYQLRLTAAVVQFVSALLALSLQQDKVEKLASCGPQVSPIISSRYFAWIGSTRPNPC